MKIIKHLSERNLIILALTWTFGIMIASLISMNNMPSIQLPGKDKLVHFLFYFVLTLLWNFALQSRFKNNLLKYKIVFIVIIYGIIIEVLQGTLTQKREADLYDVFANSGGALLALVVIFWLNSKTFKKKV